MGRGRRVVLLPLLGVLLGVIGLLCQPLAVAQTPTPTAVCEPRPCSPASPTGGPPPEPRFYAAGWNLVAVSQTGTPIPTATPLYTLSADGTTYEAVTPTQPERGVGYWAYFPRDTRSFLVPVSPGELGAPTIALPAGHWVMIGDPYTAYIAVYGADVVEVYDPVAGSYQQVTQLAPGQGAFVYSATGGQLTFGP